MRIFYSRDFIVSVSTQSTIYRDDCVCVCVYCILCQMTSKLPSLPVVSIGYCLNCLPEYLERSCLCWHRHADDTRFEYINLNCRVPQWTVVCHFPTFQRQQMAYTINITHTHTHTDVMRHFPKRNIISQRMFMFCLYSIIAEYIDNKYLPFTNVMMALSTV